jgi:hypothetical protein
MESLLYYIGLYLLVFILKFISVARKPSPDTYDIESNNANKPNWNYVLHISLDIVYTSAGFAIVLIENLKTWIPAIMVIYVILVILSTSVDNLNYLSLAKRTYIHIAISLFVIISTFLGYWLNFGKPIVPKEVAKQYKVLIPYLDLSLMKHTGLDFLNAPENNFRVIIKCDDLQRVKQMAVDSFYLSSKVVPLYPSKDLLDKRAQLKINYEEIIVVNF